MVQPWEVKIFDSIYETLDTGALQVVKRLFDDGKELKVTVTMASGVPEQQGSTDYGSLTKVVGTRLAFEGNPAKWYFTKQQ